MLFRSDALKTLAQPAALSSLTDRLGLDVAPEEIAARLNAIACTPSKDAIEEIIKFRSSGGKLGERTELGYRRRFAREAFMYATGVDVGPDPDAMRKWWKDNEKDFDFAAAAERRAKDAKGGAKLRPSDGKSPDTGSKGDDPK